MRNHLKQLAIAAGIALYMATSSAAAAVTVKLGVGGNNKTSAYTNTYGAAIKKRAAEVGINIELVYGNSGKNLDGLYNGEIDVGLAQGDVHVAKSMADDEFGEVVASLGVVGSEALLCAYNTTGRLKEWGEVEDTEAPDKAYKISADTASSGTRFSVNTIRNNIPAITASTEIYMPEEKGREYGVARELSRLRSGKRDLVCMVLTPDPLATEGFIALVNQDKQLSWLTIDSSAVEGIKDKKGNQAYTSADATIGGNRLMVWIGKGDLVRVPHTPVSVYVNLESKVMTDEVMSKLTKIVQDPDLLPADTPAALAARAYRSAMKTAESIVAR